MDPVGPFSNTLSGLSEDQLLDLIVWLVRPNLLDEVHQTLAGQMGSRPFRRATAVLRQKQIRLAPDQVFDLVHDYQDGTTIKQLVAKYGISRTTVITHLRREDIQTRYNKLDGKLGEVKELRTQGWSYARIGQQFGVTAHTVRRAIGRN